MATFKGISFLPLIYSRAPPSSFLALAVMLPPPPLPSVKPVAVLRRNSHSASQKENDKKEKREEKKENKKKKNSASYRIFCPRSSLMPIALAAASASTLCHRLTLSPPDSVFSLSSHTTLPTDQYAGPAPPFSLSWALKLLSNLSCSSSKTFISVCRKVLPAAFEIPN